MKIRYKPLLKKLDAKSTKERLAAIMLLKRIIDSGGLEEPLRQQYNQ